jgi:hypothetical protein
MATGLVRCVWVSDVFGVTGLQLDGGPRELFVLWWDGDATSATPPEQVRAIQRTWVDLLRQAMATKTFVTITNVDGSNVVESVQLGQP